VALVEAGVIANVHGCDGRWCSVSIDDYRGYLPQKDLWGVYEGEIVK
jgi:SH3-like domain-containing protein